MEPSRQAAPRPRSVGNIALVSGIVTLLVVLVGFGLWYLFSPRQIEVQVPARGQQDGKVSATVVATKLGSTDTLFSKKIDATIAKETFFATVALPSDVQKSAYTLQLCLNDSTDDCASVASAPRSCSYYVAPSKSDKLATMFGRNTISYDNRLGCDESSKDFVAGRPVSDVKSTTNTGLAVTGDGIVVAKNGTLATMTSDELASKVGEKLTGLIPTTNTISSPTTNVHQTTNSTTNTTNTTALTQVTNNYTTVGADAQTLSLSGTVLSITGGNSVDLSALQNGSTPVGYADATHDGMLRASDWQAFNAKQDVLTFDSSFVVTGTNVGLMSCAVGEVMKSSGTGWVCAQDLVGSAGSTYSAGPGLSLTGTTFANTGVLSVTASGALTSSGGQNPALALQTTSDFEQLAGALALSATGVIPGTYNSLTVDANGRVTAGTNIAYLTSESDGVVGNEVSGVVPNGGLLLAGAGTAADPYSVGMITSCTDNQLLKYTSANGWACANDNDTVTTNTDNQTLTWDTTTNQLSIAGGNTVDLSSLKDNTDAQTLTLTNPSAGTHQLTISGGNTVSWTESQALSYDAATRTISLTNGGSITLPADANTTYSAGSGLTMTGTTLSVNCGTGSVAFCNGGNTFGAPATLGTNGANPLSFKTNNSVAVTLSATGELLVKDPSNSTVSFQVQDQAALPHLTIDTVNKQVLVGSSTSDATAVSLVLDSYNNATDPTGVNGSMYYNSSLGKFRCYEGGAWKDCVSRGAQVLVDGYNTTGGNYPQAYANFVYNMMNINVGNAYNTTTGVFTAPEAGYYRIRGTVTVGMPVPNNSGNNYMTFGYKKSNGGNVENQLYGASASTNNTTGYYLSGAVNRLSYLQAGEQVSFIGSWSGPAAPNIYTALGASNIQITREYTVY